LSPAKGSADEFTSSLVHQFTC